MNVLRLIASALLVVCSAILDGFLFSLSTSSAPTTDAQFSSKLSAIALSSSGTAPLKYALSLAHLRMHLQLGSLGCHGTYITVPVYSSAWAYFETASALGNMSSSLSINNT